MIAPSSHFQSVLPQKAPEESLPSQEAFEEVLGTNATVLLYVHAQTSNASVRFSNYDRAKSINIRNSVAKVLGFNQKSASSDRLQMTRLIRAGTSNVQMGLQMKWPRPIKGNSNSIAGDSWGSSS